MTTAIDAQDEVLTPAQLAQEWHTSEDTLAQQRYRGQGPPFCKVGARVLYRRKDIRDYLNDRTFGRTYGHHGEEQTRNPQPSAPKTPGKHDRKTA
jgi:hypothetical protein